MSQPTSPNAYPDCFDFFEKCMDDPLGGRKPFKNRSEAFAFRTRAHYFRSLVRKQNAQLYSPDDKRHGTSDYDEIRMTLEPAVEEGWWWVYGRKLSRTIDDVEGLSATEPVEDEEEANGDQAAE